MSHHSKHSETEARFMQKTITPREAWVILLDLGYSRANAIEIATTWLRRRDKVPASTNIVLDFEGGWECA
jgi:hypothetical protein